MRRWRNPLLLVAVVVCVGSYWLAQDERDSTDVEPQPGTEDLTSSQPAALGRSVRISVLNGTDVTGLARRMSQLLTRAGYLVVEVADAPHDTFATSLLVNRRLDRGRLADLVMRLASPTVVQEWDERCSEDAVLVLGRDHHRVFTSLRGGKTE